MKNLLIGIALIVSIVLIISGYRYYTSKIQPSSLVSSFCEKLEYEGSASLDLRDYFLSDHASNQDSLDYGDPFETRASFLDAYKHLTFSHFSIDYKKYWDKNTVQANGYVDVVYTASSEGNDIIGGHKKFSIFTKNGSQGWKIMNFSIGYLGEFEKRMEEMR